MLSGTTVHTWIPTLFPFLCNKLWTVAIVLPKYIRTTFHLTENPGLVWRKFVKACLVSGAAVIGILILPDAPCNVWALLLEGHHQGECLVVKPCVYNFPIRQFYSHMPRVIWPTTIISWLSLINLSQTTTWIWIITPVDILRTPWKQRTQSFPQTSSTETWSPAPVSSSSLDTCTPPAMSGDCCSRATIRFIVLWSNPGVLLLLPRRGICYTFLACWC